MDAAATQRLNDYFTDLGALLGNQSRRQSFAVYAMGLLGDGERKSNEPIATRACADPEGADAAHQRLLHFVSNSPWSDREVRRFAARYGLAEMTQRAPIDSWIIDDTGFLKQGRHSVGVQRQYTGSAGKVANCQIGVSLTLATRDEHVPIDFELYLPHAWTDDPLRRREARIPAAVQFKTKPELAIDMLRRAVQDGHPPGVVLADCGYGSSATFRDEVRYLGLHFAVGIDAKTKVLLLTAERPRGSPLSVRALAHAAWHTGGFRRCTWRRGTNHDLSARFIVRRVVPAHDEGYAVADREPLWLIVEWRDGEAEPANYFLASLSKRLSKKKLIRQVMQRWRTERVYEDLKGELGLDHFEGRRFQGWHHHVSVALCCYAFVIAERVRRFPPSAGRSLQDRPFQRAA
jgi:SRSO17 transposase